MKSNKCVDVVVGMQYGSESKGKLIGLIAHQYHALVRTGSVNAAHTVYFEGKPFAWHQLPAGSLHMLKNSPGSIIVLGAGAQIDFKYLEREMQWLQDHGVLADPSGDGSTPRLVIDRHATVIEDFDTYAENGYADVCGPQWYNPTTCAHHNGDVGPDGSKKSKGTCTGCSLYPEDSLHKKLGSTTHGSGMNLIRKLARGGGLVWGRKNMSFDEFMGPKRTPYSPVVEAGIEVVAHKMYAAHQKSMGQKAPPVKTVQDYADHKILGYSLSQFIGDTQQVIAGLIDQNLPIMLEGTQGAMLSVHHGTFPYTTSRDTNAAAWCSEAGVSPLSIRTVFGVARTFPIRVAGNSGPTSGRELTWKEVSEYAGVEWVESDDPAKVKGICEYTTATKRKRRIFEFGDADFHRALTLNRPQELMLSFVDYLGISNYGKCRWQDLTEPSRQWIMSLEQRHGVFFKYLSTGPKEEHTIIRDHVT